MWTPKAKPGWDRFSEEMVRLAKDRMFFPIEGVYGVMIRDHGSEDKFYFTPSGHFVIWRDGVQTHSHGGESLVRQALTDWMQERDAVRVRSH